MIRDTRVPHLTGEVDGKRYHDLTETSLEIFSEVLASLRCYEYWIGFLLEVLVWSILKDIEHQCPWLEVKWIGVDSYLGIRTKHHWDFEVINHVTGSVVSIDCCNTKGDYYLSEYKGRREHPADIQVFGKLVKGDSILDLWTGRAFEFQVQQSSLELYTGTGYQRRLRAFLWGKLVTSHPTNDLSLSAITFFPIPNYLSTEAEPLHSTNSGWDWGGTTTETDLQTPDTLLGGDST